MQELVKQVVVRESEISSDQEAAVTLRDRKKERVLISSRS